MLGSNNLCKICHIYRIVVVANFYMNSLRYGTQNSGFYSLSSLKTDI